MTLFEIFRRVDIFGNDFPITIIKELFIFVFLSFITLRPFFNDNSFVLRLFNLDHFLIIEGVNRFFKFFHLTIAILIVFAKRVIKKALIVLELRSLVDIFLKRFIIGGVLAGAIIGVFFGLNIIEKSFTDYNFSSGGALFTFFHTNRGLVFALNFMRLLVPESSRTAHNLGYAIIGSGQPIGLNGIFLGLWFFEEKFVRIYGGTGQLMHRPPLIEDIIRSFTRFGEKRLG